MRKTLAVTLLLLLAALPLAAQSLTGTVTGTIKDEQGGVLPGVTVTLLGKTGARTATTDAQGGYRFARRRARHLLRDRRDRPASGPSARTTWSSTSARVMDVHLALGVGGKTENIEVIGEAPMIDATSSSTDNSLSQDMLFNLPIRPDERRDRHAELPAGHQQRLGLRRQLRLRERAADRRRRHARPRRRLVLGVLQLQPDGRGPGRRPGRQRRVRLVHGRRREHDHEVGRQPLHGPVRRLLDEGLALERQHQARSTCSRTRRWATRSSSTSGWTSAARSAGR